VLIARVAAAQVAAFEKLSAEGARTLTVLNERYRLWLLKKAAWNRKLVGMGAVARNGFLRGLES
jgi:hypothetical protein